MKTLRRILFYLLLIVGVLLIAIISSVFLFKDKIIDQFIREANKNLSTPVKVGKIEISVFQDFPSISMVLTDVYVEDSHEGIYPLLTAKQVVFQLNPLEVWEGSYIVKGLTITDSEANLKVNEKGAGNYVILKKSNGSGGAVRFELKDVTLNKTKFHYTDISNRQDLVFSSTKLRSSIISEDNLYEIEAKGQLVCEKILIDGIRYLDGKEFDISSTVVYNDLEKNLSIRPSTLFLNKAEFNVTGNYNWKTKNWIELNTNGKNTDIQTLVSLLPASTTSKLEKYQSNGEVYFDAELTGELSRKKKPGISIEFGFNDVAIFHPELKSRIEKASLTGSFACPDVADLRMASLVLKNIKGNLNNENFAANFIMSNFENPEIICDFKGKLDGAAVQNFYPVPEIKEISGSLTADISFEGKIELLKDKATAQRVSTLGTIDLEKISFLFGKENIPLEELNGTLQFSNNDLALSDVSGKLGESDFLLNGFFKNVITFILFEDQPIGIETDLKSKYINLNQVFDFAFGSGDTNAEYTFSISRNVNLNFNCDVKSLSYKKFKAKDLKGDLLVKNEIAVSRNLSCEALGGNINLSGIVDAQNKKAIDLVSTLKVDNIHMDSAFYVFDDFQQNFIQTRHLKGRATADLNMEMTMNEHLKLFQETLIADIGVSIKNGELNNFEPLKKLSRYVDDENLSRLRFSDLKNDIHIENKKVYLPQMDIRSNVTDLKISGTHSFDQLIDYRIVTPFRRKRIADADAQKAIEETSSGPKLFLKITGTTDNYRVAYDTEAVKKKIANDIKKEVAELKEAFKGKGKKKEKEIELEEDEYFDW